MNLAVHQLEICSVFLYNEKPWITNGEVIVAEVEGAVADFSVKRWDRSNKADLIESATPCHDAQVAGSYTGYGTLSA